MTHDQHEDALVERVHGEVLAVYTDGHDHHVSDLYFHANRIIALVRADERKRIAAALLSDGAVEAANDAGSYDSGLGVVHHCGHDAVEAALAHIGISTEDAQ